MAVSSSDFERFLYANYPDDYRRATADNVPDDVLTAIVSRHSAHYDVWKNIPEWVKNRYHDILPRDVLNGNSQVKDFVLKEENSVKEEERETAEVLDFSITMLALGYSAENVRALFENRMLREQLAQAAKDDKLTPEQLEQWLFSRVKDKEIITWDWQTNQPEKYLFHLIKEMNRSERRGETIDPLKEKELAQLLPMFADKEKRNKLVDYLRQKPQQAALGHLSPEILGKFSGVLKECGINIMPAKEKGKEMEISRESLAASLKKHFQWRLKMEEMLKAQYARRNLVFANVSVRDVLSDGFKALAPLRHKAKQQEQRA